jgi:hypothetical protein
MEPESYIYSAYVHKIGFPSNRRRESASANTPERRSCISHEQWHRAIAWSWLATILRPSCPRIYSLSLRIPSSLCQKDAFGSVAISSDQVSSFSNLIGFSFAQDSRALGWFL